MDDSQLIVELASLLYGRSAASGRKPLWMREASRHMGVALATVQALVDGRQPSDLLRHRLAAWTKAEAERDRAKRKRKLALFAEVRRRLR